MDCNVLIEMLNAATVKTWLQNEVSFFLVTMKMNSKRYMQKMQIVRLDLGHSREYEICVKII